PAITRHLAAFLTRSSAMVGNRHRNVVSVGGPEKAPPGTSTSGGSAPEGGESARGRYSPGSSTMLRPDFVLFNGGFFTPGVARDRVAQSLRAWFGDVPQL